MPIRTVRGVADFTGSPVPQSVLVSLGTVVDITRSFVRVTGTMGASGGATAGQATATTVRDFSVRAQLGPDLVRILRPAGGLPSQIYCTFEVWEYTGEVGGEHEFRVAAGPLQTNIADGSTQAVVDVTLAAGFDMARCVPILMGQMSALDTADVASLHATLTRTTSGAEGASGAVIVERGGSSGVSTIAWVLVEFSGSAWNVSDGVVLFPGSIQPIDDRVWEQTIAFSTYRGASTSVAGSSYSLTYPIGSTNQLVAQQTTTNPNPGVDRAVAYLVGNPALEVFHGSWFEHDPLIFAAGTAGTPQTITITEADLGFRPGVVGKMGMIATAAGVGGTANAPRQHFAYRVTDGDEVQFFRGYAGAGANVALQIVYFEPEAFAPDEQLSFTDSWASSEEISVALNDLARTVEAGVTAVGGNEGAYAAGEIQRVLESWVATVDEGIAPPPPPESDIDFLRHNWIARVTIDTAEVTDVARSATTAVEERMGMLDRPRRTFGVQLTGLDAEVSTAYRVAITRASSGDFDLPIHSDVAEITAASSGTTIWCDPTLRRFVPGGTCIIHAYDSRSNPTGAQVRTVATVLADRLTVTDAMDGSFPAGSRVYPLARCRPAVDTPVVASFGDVIQVELAAREFEGPSTLPARSLPADVQLYRGWPVLPAYPGPNDPPTISLGRVVEQEAIGTGFFDRFMSADVGADHSVALTLTPRAVAWEALSILESRRGRALPFWITGPQSAGTVVSLSSGSITITGSLDALDVSRTYRFIAIHRRTGTPIFAQVESVQSPDAGQLVLSFDSDLPEVPAFADVYRVVPAHLVRMAADVLTEEWITTELCNVGLTVTDTRGEPDSVTSASFVEAESEAEGVIQGTPDLWCYMDAAANAMNAETPTSGDANDPDNGELIDAELWPRLDNEVHLWPDVRFVPGSGDTSDMRALVPEDGVLNQTVMRRLRTIAGATVPTGSTANTGLGSPSICRVGSFVHRLRMADTDGGADSPVPWGDTGVTFFVHLNTPPASLDPTSGGGDIIQYLGDSGGPALWFSLQLGRIRCFVNENPSPSLTPGFNAVYLDQFNGAKKLFVFRVELGVGITLWVDGAQIATAGCPAAINAVDTSRTRYFRWMGHAPGSLTVDPSLTVGNQLHVNALAIYSRALSTDEINAVASNIAARHGTSWEPI